MTGGGGGGDLRRGSQETKEDQKEECTRSAQKKQRRRAGGEKPRKEKRKKGLVTVTLGYKPGTGVGFAGNLTLEIQNPTKKGGKGTTVKKAGEGRFSGTREGRRPPEGQREVHVQQLREKKGHQKKCRRESSPD